MLTWFGGERNVPEIPHCAQKFLFHPGHSARNDARPAIEEVPAGALPESTVTAQRPDAPGECRHWRSSCPCWNTGAGMAQPSTPAPPSSRSPGPGRLGRCRRRHHRRVRRRDRDRPQRGRTGRGADRRRTADHRDLRCHRHLRDAPGLLRQDHRGPRNRIGGQRRRAHRARGREHHHPEPEPHQRRGRLEQHRGVLAPRLDRPQHPVPRRGRAHRHKRGSDPGTARSTPARACCSGTPTTTPSRTPGTCA